MKKLTKRFAALGAAVMMTASLSAVAASAATYEYYNTTSFQTKSYKVTGGKCALTGAPQIATLASTSSDYDNAAKTVQYSIYSSISGFTGHIETKKEACVGDTCTAVISTDSLNNNLSGAGTRQYESKLYNNSNTGSGVYESLNIVVYKRNK